MTKVETKISKAYDELYVRKQQVNELQDRIDYLENRNKLDTFSGGITMFLIRRHKYGYLYKQRIPNVVLCEPGRY